MTEQFYKVLGPGQVSCHGGSGKWVKGRWRSVEGKLVPCSNGIHLCRREDLVRWLNAQIWEVEWSGEMVRAENKVVVRRACVVKRLTRWNTKTQRLFAADCAEKALTLVPNPDPRSVKAIRVARLFARGKATRKELAAAWAAAWDAARAAAGDAARAWQTERLFDYLEGEP